MSLTGNDPQDPNTLGGKVLRLNDDGSVPKDNPFVGQAGQQARGLHAGPSRHARPGHASRNRRNVAEREWPERRRRDQHSQARPQLWLADRELRPRLPRSLAQRSALAHAGFEAPVVYWMPAIGVSGMAFYTGDKLPKWKGDVFVGALRTGEIPGTGHLERILFNDKMEELRRESLLTELRQRIRDVRQGPDGLPVRPDRREGRRGSARSSRRPSRSTDAKLAFCRRLARVLRTENTLLASRPSTCFLASGGKHSHQKGS